MRAKLKEVARQVGRDAVAYQTVRARANENEKKLDPRQGYVDQLHFEDASLAETEGVLRHIAVADAAFEASRGKSATTPLFNKTLLMPLDGGGQLRHHTFRIGASALGDEENPHSHRWNLKTGHQSGAYIQNVYEDTHAQDPDAIPALRYELDATPKDKSSRGYRLVGEVDLRRTKAVVYSDRQGPHDFPLRETHSVGDLSAHTGTTVTLARTSKGWRDKSITHSPRDVVRSTDPLSRAPDADAFRAGLHQSIARVQLIQLRELLTDFLQQQDPSTLTEGERRHLVDAQAPNYLETSLLPALATLGLAREAGAASTEFSPRTAAFLASRLARIKDDPKQALLAQNDEHLRAGLLSTGFDDHDALAAWVAEETRSRQATAQDGARP